MTLFATLRSIHKTVTVRPTRYFIALVAVIVALFAEAYMHNYNIVYVMMFFVTAVAGTSTLFGMLNLYPLRLSFLSAGRLFAHSPGKLTFALRNESSYPCYDFHVRNGEEAFYFPSIAPNESKTFTMEGTFALRGIHPLPSFRIDSLFPLFHEIKHKTLAIEETVTVYPAALGESLEEARHIQKASQGDINDFDQVERYQKGENISRIHWPSLAKSDTMMSKKFIFERPQQTLRFVFQQLPGEKETRLSQLTLWVLECEARHQPFVIDLNGVLLDSRQMSTDAILTQLSLY